jgi:hypothetical protein
MSAKKHHVTLTEEQRQQLTCQSLSQKGSLRERKRARILLLADEGPFHEPLQGGASTDVWIAKQVRACPHTVERVRQRFAQAKEQDQDAVKATLHHAPQQKRKPRLLDGRAEAHLIALTCSAPPDGHKRWGLHLLKDTLIEQQITDTISHETVRQTLKKMNSNPG